LNSLGWIGTHVPAKVVTGKRCLGTDSLERVKKCEGDLGCFKAAKVPASPKNYMTMKKKKKFRDSSFS